MRRTRRAGYAGLPQCHGVAVQGGCRLLAQPSQRGHRAEGRALRLPLARNAVAPYQASGHLRTFSPGDALPGGAVAMDTHGHTPAMSPTGSTARASHCWYGAMCCTSTRCSSRIRKRHLRPIRTARRPPPAVAVCCSRPRPMVGGWLVHIYRSPAWAMCAAKARPTPGAGGYSPLK